MIANIPQQTHQINAPTLKILWLFEETYRHECWQ
jgi:hypothetical protein